MSEDSSPAKGHNNPPSPIEILMEDGVAISEIVGALPAIEAAAYDELRALIVQISTDSAEWIKLGAIDDPETAAVAADHIAQLRAAKKKVEAAQKAAKKVWADKATVAYDAFKPLIGSADKGVEKMLAIQGDWLRREQARLDAEAAAAREKAAKERAAMEAEKARAEESGDTLGMAEAEAREKEVKAAEKAANRAAKERANVGTASGVGRGVSMRKVKVAKVENYAAAMMHYRKHPEMLALIDRLAAADARAASFDVEKDTIPGVTVTIEEVPA